MQVYLDNQDKILTAIAIPQRSPDTFGQTIRRMREEKVTFEEAIKSEEFLIVDKSSLFRVQTDEREALQKLNRKANEGLAGFVTEKVN